MTQRIDYPTAKSARGDALRVRLVRPTSEPEMCVIVWPADMVATITRVLSNSVIDLAARRYKTTRDDAGEDE